MKITISLLSAAVAVTAAQPHRHGHNHAHDKREPNPVADVVVVPGPTEIAYVLNGEAISEADVQEGIRNGTLIWAQGGGVSEVSSEAPSTSAAYVPSSTSSSEYVAPTTSSTEYSSAPAYTPESSSSSAWAAPWSAWSPPSSSTSEAASSTSSAPSYTSASSSNSGSSSSGFSASNSGVNTPFPDGEVDCSTFPSEYGAVAVDWLGLGGWTGVQSPGDSSGGFSDIKTVTSGGSCTEGAYCSYACPAGYLKSQWPTTQGATGQSVGGVLCQNGKLHLTNSAMSSNLCMYGSSEVTILVNNTLSGSNDNVAVCRTDYPGTEGETVPLNLNPGDSDELACPDASNYYNWEGGHTSAQYYVNPSGVSVDDACQWGSADNDWGNWAPLNLGVGYSSGAAWLAIFQNAPTTYKSLDFSVEVIGDGIGPGEGKQTCRYANGQYCGGENYSSCSASTGCTVSLSSGTATFVFSNGS